jgi:hypothetical protein
MTLDWPNLIVGAVLGFLAHWLFVYLEKQAALRKLRKIYSHLAGDYANFRVKNDSTEESTRGEIKLAWQSDGSFKVQGLHENGVADWEGIIRMSQEFEGSGTGHYRHVGTGHGHGTQQITYVSEARYFSVMGTSTSRMDATPFLHHWKRIEP